MQVEPVETGRRSESERRELAEAKARARNLKKRPAQRLPTGCLASLLAKPGGEGACHVRTRKATIYARGGRSQGKPWWKVETVLTCKSFVVLGHRGERPIESLSSWFPAKFPSGKQTTSTECTAVKTLIRSPGPYKARLILKL